MLGFKKKKAVQNQDDTCWKEASKEGTWTEPSVVMK